MRITLFVWDHDNIGHIARHGLHNEEVDEVLDHVHRTVRTRHSYYMLYGRSASGRYLAVVVQPLEDQRARVVTARDMSETEKRRFRRLL